MNWTEVIDPNSENSYSHIKCDTPLGKIYIDWKSWKTNPSFDISIDGSWIGTSYDLDESKQISKDWLTEKYNSLKSFLEG